ncbi:MAG: 5-methyltetrahydropteroyltriglutamate--homocysteine S-methyltransferase [Alphaproteobacteria bacterium]|nr:5-methyltetrahydropteroyltriglutamate--homocysteine S-methyltransferase [Alphaproteobacteria bacterium]
MAAVKYLPSRADVVGSLLRPQAIHDARSRFSKGEIDRAALRKIESACIAEAVALQKDCGLKAATDGEFHRRHWFMDFIERIDGVGFAGGLPTRFQTESGAIEFSPPRVITEKKLRRTQSLALDDFRDLKPVADRMGMIAKQPIPSPTLVHFRSGDPGVDRKVYPDIAEYYHDLAQVYREEIQALYDAGCRYAQIDETNFPFLCDPNMHEHVRSIGEDPVKIQHKYRDLINAVTKDRPSDLIIAMHMCRGNHESAWAASGGYEFVSEVAFGGLDIDVFFLEYDTDRAGDFAPLRHLSANKIAVLGLVTSKKPQLESKDALKQRIHEATKYVQLDRLAISPQCGFASTIGGNRLTVEDEKAKIRLCVETAREVWG